MIRSSRSPRSGSLLPASFQGALLSMKLVLLLCAAAVAAGWSPMAGLKIQSRATAVHMGATTDWVRRVPAR